MQEGQTAAAPGAGGYWGRDIKNARVWVSTCSQQAQNATVKDYIDGGRTQAVQSMLARQADQKQADEWRSKRPYVLCFKNINSTPRPESSMTARSNISLASSIAFSNNPWTNTPRIGGTHVYTKVGSRVFRAQSFEPADHHYERTRPPDIPNTSTAQGGLGGL